MADVVQQLFNECKASHVRIVCPWKQDLPGENVVGLEARRNGHHALKTEPEQTCSSQQHECQGNLRDDEAMTQELRGAATRSTSALRLEGITQMASKIEPRNRRCEHDAHDDGCYQGD